jgi:hypothetical protein
MIAEHYFDTPRNLAESLRVWYANLLKQMGTNDMNLRTNARSEHRQANRQLTAFLYAWERAFNKGVKYRISEVQQPVDWVTDLLQAIRIPIGE